MRRLACLTGVLALLALAGCGDDESSPSTGASGATGAQQAEPESGMTAKEFIDAPIPDQLKAVRELVAADPDCAEVDASPGGDFQIAVAINAAEASPGTPLADVVADQCSRG